MISATGRMPVIAAPMAAPTIACSEIGVSQTRSAPNSSNSPTVVLKTPPAAPMSSPMQTTVGSRRISRAIPSATDSRYVVTSSLMRTSRTPCRPAVGPHVGERLRGVRGGRRPRGLDRRADDGRRAVVGGLDVGDVDAHAREVASRDVEGIALHPLLDLGCGAV